MRQRAIDGRIVASLSLLLAVLVFVVFYLVALKIWCGYQVIPAIRREGVAAILSRQMGGLIAVESRHGRLVRSPTTNYGTAGLSV